MPTISDILATQTSLVQEASEALPFSFSQCTYSKGYIRQALYYCITCAEPRGICSACSVACHTDHEQVELFPKRHFRCDCPTNSIPHACTLHSKSEEPNAENAYNHNFRAEFCRCGRPYDAQNERETMIQCLACEDWFHESCLNLRERPGSREPTPEPQQVPAVSDDTPTGAEGDDDAASEASSSDLPPPLITASQYESLVCRDCVCKVDILRRWAGTPGVLMVVRDSNETPWKVIGESVDEPDVDIDSTANVGSLAGQKRARSDTEDDGSDLKRTRTGLTTSSSSSSVMMQCLAPPVNTAAESILAAWNGDAGASETAKLCGAGDIFLTEGFRERWCKCEQCSPPLKSHSYLLQEEETYEHPEDPDSGLSLEELGMRALERIPRDRAIDGIHAFNEMRDQLMSHLRPFAQQDKVVTEADIRAFFAGKMAEISK